VKHDIGSADGISPCVFLCDNRKDNNTDESTIAVLLFQHDSHPQASSFGGF
jgi:hypothetical protein